jgi:hypothetical protein
MSRQRSGYEPARGGAVAVAAPRQLKLSGLIQQRMAANAQKHRQHVRLVHALIVAQAIFTAAAAAGYVGAPSAALHLTIGTASVALYLVALVTSAFFHKTNVAAYLLVGGGLIAVAAQTISLAIEPAPALTAQAALLFIALTFEASLLFTPEVTLLVAFISTVCTASAILFTLSLAPNMDQSTAYLLMVYPVGLQALAGIIAWVVAHSAAETALAEAREEETHFAQARLEAMIAQRMELDDQLKTLQKAITSALGGGSQARAEVPDGTLAPLAESLNVLLERLADLSQADVDLTRMGAASLVMNDVLTQIADAPTPTPSSLPIMTNTPLDSVQLRLAQTAANLSARITRMQRLASDLLGVLGNSQQPLDGATESVQEARSLAGVLISAADSMLTLTTRQLTVLQRVRRQLASQLPAELTGPLPEPPAMPSGAEGLSGRDLAGLREVIGQGDVTDTFAVLEPRAENETLASITPLTRPMSTLGAGSDTEPDAAGQQRPEQVASGDASLTPTPELVDLWRALADLDGEMRTVDQTVAKLARDMSTLSKTLRSADGDLAYTRQALMTIRASADAMQQLAGAGLSVPQTPGALPSALPNSISRPLDQTAQPPDTPTMPPDAPAGLGTAMPTPLDPNEPTPSPGSLRAADLLQFSGDLANLEQAQNGPGGSTDRDSETSGG